MGLSLVVPWRANLVDWGMCEDLSPDLCFILSNCRGQVALSLPQRPYHIGCPQLDVSLSCPTSFDVSHDLVRAMEQCGPKLVLRSLDCIVVGVVFRF